MATTHRDALTCAWLLAGVSGLLQHANVHAQERTHSVTPLIGVKLEHTDNVPQTATWHLQVAGRKVWTLRPSDELLGGTLKHLSR